MELIDGKVPKILIVDDVDINITIIKKCVEKMGYTALTATSAKEAVNQFYVEMPHMVLLDIVMSVLRCVKGLCGDKGYSHYFYLLKQYPGGQKKGI